MRGQFDSETSVHHFLRAMKLRLISLIFHSVDNVVNVHMSFSAVLSQLVSALLSTFTHLRHTMGVSE
jgi:hypothetical protein